MLLKDKITNILILLQHTAVFLRIKMTIIEAFDYEWQDLVLCKWKIIKTTLSVLA